MKHTKQCVNRHNTQGQAVLKQATPKAREKYKTTRLPT